MTLGIYQVDGVQVMNASDSVRVDLIVHRDVAALSHEILPLFRQVPVPEGIGETVTLLVLPDDHIHLGGQGVLPRGDRLCRGQHALDSAEAQVVVGRHELLEVVD